MIFLFFAKILCKISDGLFFNLYIRFLYKIGGINYINGLLRYLQNLHLKKIMTKFNATIDANSYFVSSIIIDNTTKDYANLKIGKHCCIGTNTFFDLVEPINIEDEVAISAEVMFLTHSDPGERPLGKHYKRKTGSIRVGRGAWIGARAIILPGVTIGECSVIGAGAVVNKDVPSYSMAVGVPAKTIKKLQ